MKHASCRSSVVVLVEAEAVRREALPQAECHYGSAGEQIVMSMESGRNRRHSIDSSAVQNCRWRAVKLQYSTQQLQYCRAGVEDLIDRSVEAAALREFGLSAAAAPKLRHETREHLLRVDPSDVGGTGHHDERRCRERDEDGDESRARRDR